MQAAGRAAQAPPVMTRYQARLAKGDVRSWQQIRENMVSKKEQVSLLAARGVGGCKQVVLVGFLELQVLSIGCRNSCPAC